MRRRRTTARVRFVDDPEPEDPWGPEGERGSIQPPAIRPQQTHQVPLQVAPARPQSAPATLQNAQHTPPHRPTETSTGSKDSKAIPISSRHKAPGQPEQHKQQLPSLQKLCLGILGRHVTQLVEQLDGQLGFLPADAKAALLAVARRRGELTSRVLSALADPEWSQLDLSGCRQLYAAEVLQAAPLLPNIRVLDVTGFEQLVSGGWRQFARAWPALSVIRLGGSQSCSQEALKALPHILPGIAQPASAAVAAVTNSSSNKPASSSEQHPAAAAPADDPAEDGGLDSWEDAFASDSDDPGPNSHSNSQSNDNMTSLSVTGYTDQAAATTAAAAVDCRLKQLRALIWPDIPGEAVQLVQQRCPKVLINPPMKRDKVTGQLPPRELDGSVVLDQPYMDMVGPYAVEDILPANRQQPQQQDIPVLSLAEKFRTAYIQQAARLREKEWRQQQQEKKRQLRSSHALRTMNAWLDAPA